MSGEGRPKITYELVRFVVEIVTITLLGLMFYGKLDSRVTIAETKLDQKVELKDVMDRIDKLELKLESKIENEFQKLKIRN